MKNNKSIFAFIIVCIFSYNLYCSEKPDSTTVFSFYSACATGDFNTVEKFLLHYPDCADIELFQDIVEIEGYDYIAYSQFANFLIGKEIETFDENEKEEEKEYIKNYHRYPINIAARYGHIEIVKLLIQNNSNLELQEEHGTTPLMASIVKGHDKIASLLLEKNININTQNDKGKSALMFAASYDRTEIVKTLLKMNADTSLRDYLGFNAFMLSVNFGYLDIVKILLPYSDINEKIDDGATALALAAEIGNNDIVTYLLENGANVNDVKNNGMTPLIMASIFGHKDVITTLIKNNAIIDYKDSIGNTALMNAAYKCHEDCFDELIKFGANINERNISNDSVLLFAVAGGNASIVSKLLELNVNINTTNNDNITALYYACSHGFTDVVIELLKYNPDLNIVSFDNTVFCVAAINGHTDILELLMDKDADLGNSKQLIVDVMKPLTTGHPESCSTILKNKKYARMFFGFPGTPKLDDLTILMCAARDGNYELTKIILEYDVDVNYQNNQGATALILATYNNHFDIVKLLIEAGADVKLKDNLGFRAINYATIHKDNPELLLYLYSFEEE